MPADVQTRRARRSSTSWTVGVLSDTHGHINEAALAILKQTDVILHAGDIDRPKVLDALHTIGRIIPVRGNMDIGAWAEQLPKEEFVELGPILIYVTHDRTKISLDPEAAGIHVVVSGHTHRPEMMRKNGVLYLNPGSASFPRGGPQASIALLRINDGIIACRHITL